MIFKLENFNCVRRRNAHGWSRLNYLLILAGKGFLSFIRLLKSKKMALKSGKLGKYYKGGFDQKMNRREAALILSIRESSTRTEVKDSHKRLMMLNHPDAGGSTYLASKINEAKELLMLTASDEKL